MRTPLPADKESAVQDLRAQLVERATVRPSQAQVTQPQEITTGGYLRIVAPDNSTIGYLAPDGIQFIRDWLLKDAGSNVVVQPDPAGGLAKPSLPITLHRTRSSNWPLSTSATFETIFDATVVKVAPRMSLTVSTLGDVAGTAGEWQVRLNGTTVVASGTISDVQTDAAAGPFAVSGALGSSVLVEVQIRRTAGTGNVRVEPKNLRWRES